MLVFILKNLGNIFRKSVIHNILTKYKFLSKYKQATKLDFNILIFFKLFFISEVITKKNRLYFEKKANDYEKKYTLSEDWFSFNIPIWDHVINKEFGIEKICPDNWIGQMASFEFPFNDDKELYAIMKNNNIVVPVMKWNNKIFIRISINGYNTSDDFSKLMEVLTNHFVGI